MGKHLHAKALKNVRAKCKDSDSSAPEDDDEHFSNNSGPFHNYIEFMKRSKGTFIRDALWWDQLVRPW
jgi:hypothetical protein